MNKKYIITGMVIGVISAILGVVLYVIHEDNEFYDQYCKDFED